MAVSFFINLNNMKNLGGESATDHLCQIIFQILPVVLDKIFNLFFLLVAMATNFLPGIEIFNSLKRRPPKIIHV